MSIVSSPSALFEYWIKYGNELIGRGNFCWRDDNSHKNHLTCRFRPVDLFGTPFRIRRELGRTQCLAAVTGTEFRRNHRTRSPVAFWGDPCPNRAGGSENRGAGLLSERERARRELWDEGRGERAHTTRTIAAVGGPDGTSFGRIATICGATSNTGESWRAITAAQMLVLCDCSAGLPSHSTACDRQSKNGPGALSEPQVGKACESFQQSNTV